MADDLRELIAQVTDEKSFLRFLKALTEESGADPAHDCSRTYRQCSQLDHFETRLTKDFLLSVEDWASGGDFADGVHHGEPMLRRVATMLYVGRYFRSEDRPRG
ncbi:MAG: hypothetical protein ABI779_13470 [Acidobacteriota bacterium]